MTSKLSILLAKSCTIIGLQHVVKYQEYISVSADYYGIEKRRYRTNFLWYVMYLAPQNPI